MSFFANVLRLCAGSAPQTGLFPRRGARGMAHRTVQSVFERRSRPSTLRGGSSKFEYRNSKQIRMTKTLNGKRGSVDVGAKRASLSRSHRSEPRRLQDLR